MGKTALGTKLEEAFTAVKVYYKDKSKAGEWSSALSAWQTVWKEYVAAAKAAGVTIGADAPKDTKSMKWWGILLIVLGCLAVVCTLGYFLLRKPTASNDFDGA